MWLLRKQLCCALIPYVLPNVNSANLFDEVGMSHTTVLKLQDTAKGLFIPPYQPCFSPRDRVVRSRICQTNLTVIWINTPGLTSNKWAWDIPHPPGNGCSSNSNAQHESSHGPRKSEEKANTYDDRPLQTAKKEQVYSSGYRYRHLYSYHKGPS